MISLETRGAELQRVVEFVVQAHANQFRKHSGLPYVCHPIAVLSQLAEWDIEDMTTWMAGLCHDVREECPEITHDILVDTIGPEAADVVNELTFVPDLSSPATVKEQKTVYLESFATKSLQALVIKAADRALNSCDFMCVDPKYAKKYWRMGKPIFQTVMQKAEEIKAAFGESAYPRIMYTRSNLNGVFQE